MALLEAVFQTCGTSAPKLDKMLQDQAIVVATRPGHSITKHEALFYASMVLRRSIVMLRTKNSYEETVDALATACKTIAQLLTKQEQSQSILFIQLKSVYASALVATGRWERASEQLNSLSPDPQLSNIDDILPILEARSNVIRYLKNAHLSENAHEQYSLIYRLLDSMNNIKDRKKHYRVWQYSERVWFPSAVKPKPFVSHK